ncbi:FAD-binding protein [Kurthia gibsonii]
MLSIKKMRQGRFENWAGNVKKEGCTPHEPQTIEEICTFVSHVYEKGGMIRSVGAAHSFSPVAKPEQHLVSLHHMRGLLDVDAVTQQATFWGGTYLHEVGPILARYNLALENMGDIAEQTIAGAISTGTHGTGLKLTSLSN